LAGLKLNPHWNSDLEQAMSDVDFEKYSEQSVHFFSRQVPEMLAKSIGILEGSKTMVDVGCGDGQFTSPGGFVYLSTVIRKRGAWYFRRSPDGRRVLDSTHLREYAASNDVTRLLEDGGFKIVEIRRSRLFFPIANPVVRWLPARWPFKAVQQIFLQPATRWMEAFSLPIPRYRSIEILAQRRDRAFGGTSDL